MKNILKSKDIDNLQSNDYELIIVENDDYEIFIFFFIHHLNIYLNKDYDNDDNVDIEQSFTNDTIYIKKIINIRFKFIRFLRCLYSTKKKLKMHYFDRQHVENCFVNIRFSFFY